MCIFRLMRKTIILIFFFLQIGGIIYSRFREDRYFCWVPYDEISTYKIVVKIANHTFLNQEITDRYKIENPGRENRSIGNVKSIIRQYETTYGSNDGAIVLLIYNTNGKGEKTWIWAEN